MTQQTAATSFPLDKPTPRRPKSSKQAQLIIVQNRRREYLQRHPSYVKNLDHELKDPILYERLIKRFQTSAERESEFTAKGYSRTLEADLLRGEARLFSINPTRESTNGEEEVEEKHHPQITPEQQSSRLLMDEEQPWHGEAESRQDGQERWALFLEDTFIRGQDEEFDYAKVDNDDDLDEEARREEQDAWFDEEEPAWEGREKEGETGVQDF